MDDEDAEDQWMIRWSMNYDDDQWIMTMINGRLMRVKMINWWSMDDNSWWWPMDNTEDDQWWIMKIINGWWWSMDNNDDQWMKMING